MKFWVTFKTPDAVENVVLEILNSESEAIMDPETGVYSDEEDIAEKVEQIKDFCTKWIYAGECVTLEIDTENETCIVLENK